MDWHTVYIALGSNVGDRKTFLVRAVDALMHTPGVRVADLSRIIETEPVGMRGEEEPFLNAVLSAQVTLAPDTLMGRLREIERSLGRPESHRRNTARTIDLDLLLYDDLVQDDPQATIPHPRMHERLFVLEPLLEIAPAGITHPRLGTALSVLRDAL
jgi:2-amino-4-hydroxy-6-hydroxymethyldihydropteridine diphosphokinase